MPDVSAFAPSLTATSHDVFLCHKSSDKGVVKRLHELLQQNRVRSWFDAADLGAGERWHQGLLDGLNNSRVIAICLGPDGLGPWQKEEIQIAKQKQVNEGKLVVPLILPTCSANPVIPEWWNATHTINLLNEGLMHDPFAELLHAVDGRPKEGRYRPTVLVLANQNEPTVADGLAHIKTACGSLLQRVRVLDYSKSGLKADLETLLAQSDLFVSLLSLDSFTPLGDTFPNGIAEKARELARAAKKPLLEWRSEALPIPDSDGAAPFKNSSIKKWLPKQFANDVTESARERFSMVAPTNGEPTDRKKSILGFPNNGSDFARKIQTYLSDNHHIRCDSAGKWERVSKRLTSSDSHYDALIVILNGDDQWYDECSEWLDQMEESQREAIPVIGAYCHRTENPDEAQPRPLDLDEFEEYFGKPDLPKLAQRILAGGAE